MGKDPSFVKTALAKTSHIVNIIALKRAAYRKIGKLDEFGYKSEEPIAWEELDKGK